NELRRIVALAEPNSTLLPDMIAEDILGAMPLLRPGGREFAVSLHDKLPSALRKIECEMIKIALREHRGKVDAAARALGISRMRGHPRLELSEPLGHRFAARSFMSVACSWSPSAARSSFRCVARPHRAFVGFKGWTTYSVHAVIRWPFIKVPVGIQFPMFQSVSGRVPPIRSHGPRRPGTGLYDTTSCGDASRMASERKDSPLIEWIARRSQTRSARLV